ncbi:MAG: hypothetical protein WCQ26_04180, partial [Pseudanabaena sp. ELA748]
GCLQTRRDKRCAMNETAISSLMKAPEEINPLLEILWEIEQYEEQGQQLIEIGEIELENFTEATIVSKQNSCLLQRSLDNLKKAHPIAAPAVIRGF